MSAPRPAYLALHESGELAQRAARMAELLDPCSLCPRRCGARRMAGELGVCGVGSQVAVARACHHRGEEPPISGSRGAGTIFFAGCNLVCTYCQNHQISRRVDRSTVLHARSLADKMLGLQEQGVHNLSLVTPSHVVPQILEALDLAAERGLRLPLVYNTSAYERLEVLRELDGVVDVYLPDLRYGDDAMAMSLSTVADYVAHSQRAVREMQRQVGRLQLDDHGAAWRGLILRHLVLPDDLAATGSVLRFIAEELGTDTTISLMAQYRPPPELSLPSALSRPLRPSEYDRARVLAQELGLHQGWIQDLEATDTYVPDFDAAAHPFERGVVKTRSG